MKRAGLWTFGLASSVVLHVGAGIVLWQALIPDPLEEQPSPESRLRVESQIVERRDVAQADAEPQQAAEADSVAAQINEGAPERSRARPADPSVSTAGPLSPPVASLPATAGSAEPLGAALPPSDRIAAAPALAGGKIGASLPPVQTAKPSSAPAAQTVQSAFPRAQVIPVAQPRADVLPAQPQEARPALAPAPPAQSALQAVSPPPTAVAAVALPAAGVVLSARPEASVLRAAPTEFTAAAPAVVLPAAALPAPAQALATNVPRAKPAPTALPLARPDAPAAPLAQPDLAVVPQGRPEIAGLPDSPPDVPKADVAAPQAAALATTLPQGDKIRAQLAFPGQGGDVDPVSLAAFQSFVAPGAAPQGAAVRDDLSAILSKVPCSRLQVAFDPDTATLRINGHVPINEARAPVLAALQAQMGDDITVSDNMLILPKPQCDMLTGIAAAGLPQSTDQFTNPLVVGPDTHALVKDFVKDDRLWFEATGPDYDAFVYVDFFDAAGNVLHVAPNPQSPLIEVAAKETFRIGTRDDADGPFALLIGPPYGQEIAVAFAASRPLYDDIRPVVEPAAPYLTWLKEQIARARAADPGFKGEWVYFFIRTAEG